MNLILIRSAAFVILINIPILPAKTITVDDDGGADYVDLEMAADAATAGDTILVADGEYAGHIHITKPLTVLGSGPERCTIFGNDGVMSIRAEDGSIIDGFIKVAGFSFEVEYMHVRALTLYIYNCSPVISNNIFNDCEGNCHTIEIAGASSPKINYNDFVNPQQPVIEVRGDLDVDARNNWWGTTDPDEIQSLNIDGNDEDGRGFIDFEPFLLNSTVQNIEFPQRLANTILLSQNYPNPFNSMTNISFSLNRGDYVWLDIFNENGQKVIQLLNAYKPKGTYQISWEGVDENGLEVNSGMYFYRLETARQCQTRQLILLK